MKRLIAGLRAYRHSLAWRITLLLALGIAGASILSLFVADHVRLKELEHVQFERVVASSRDMAGRFARRPDETARLLAERELYGVRLPFDDLSTAAADPRLEALFRQSMGEAAHATIRSVVSSCFSRPFDSARRVAGLDPLPDIQCWLVGFDDAHGVRRTFLVDLPALHLPRSATLDPIYLMLIMVASALASLFAARLTTVPLRRLAEAARRFSVSMDPAPIAGGGPAEVRSALDTFNLMQQRVRDGFRERTHMLAAIAHDLQTPMTRLRLRLEQVPDEALRDRLVRDLASMQQLVRDGLELARSSESREPWSMVELDFLVASLVEDAEEAGQPVRLGSNCGVVARIKPDALTRALSNLIDNAVKYGGGAEISCRMAEDRVAITVRDHGPGFPEGRIEEMLEPFVRGEGSRSRETGGTGIGLTIARAQASTFGATLTIANHPDGGAVATLAFPRG